MANITTSDRPSVRQPQFSINFRNSGLLDRHRNGPFLLKEGGTPAEYKAGLAFAITRGWLWKHESGT